MKRTYEYINDRIKDGDVVVCNAEDVISSVEESGLKKVQEEVDVITCATMGPMCSSGLFLNTGHADPPIRIRRATLNGVPAYCGLAAVDLYLGATEAGPDPGYGGAQVIEDLVRGKEIEMVAEGAPSDCYPSKGIRTSFTLDEINEAIMFNPRNAYQNYAAGTNSTNERIHTYLGRLEPDMGNVCYSSSGQLNPLLNDPYLETIGVGTSILVGGARGHIAWEGTQSRYDVDRSGNGTPLVGAATLGIAGNLKEMAPDHLRAVNITGYGTSLSVGIGIPLPVLNDEVLRHACIRDRQIRTRVYDYGVQRRDRPCVAEFDYGSLRSGSVELNGKEVPTSTFSSYSKAKEIANDLAERIRRGSFHLTEPIRRLSPPPMTRPLPGGNVIV